MATLILTAVGSAIGGPIGGAIGSIIGQQVDAAIFAPKPRQGPRLKELEVQTSSYGSQIPAIFGAMRVAGTVFWATDLIERRAKSGGGKGRPSTVNYSYSVSLAVAISSRPIARVGRIWADGNLLRGGAGDLKVDAQIRIYSGDEDQSVDPLMAAAEATGQVSANRGLAYVMFEDLQLADYGNRIPSLTFEIFERDGPVPVSAIIDAATSGEVQATVSQNIDGFALSGTSAIEPLATLLEIFPVEIVARDGVLLARDPVSPSANSVPVKAASQENREFFDQPRQSLVPALRLPHVMTLRYYDGGRDYQASLQRSERGPVSRITSQIELPAVLNAVQAKQILEQKQSRMFHDRKRWRADIAQSEFQLSPGDLITAGGRDIWRIDQVEHRFGTVTVSARAAHRNRQVSGPSATPGRSLPAADLVIGETRIAVLEMPVFGNSDPAKPIIAVFAAGTQGGWRRAGLSILAGDALADIGPTAPPANMGVSLEPLAQHAVSLIDEGASLRVQLLHAAMNIANRTGSPLDIDAPYFWLNGEFVRFGNCEALGNQTFRLSRLLRGCFRSDFVVQASPANSRFILIEPDRARLIEEYALRVGETVTLEALGLADTIPVSDAVTIQGLATRPLAPVHGGMQVLADGSVLISWVRRSRIDDGWRDGVDQILAEEQENYLVSLSVDAVVQATWSVSAPRLSISAGEWQSFAIPPSAHAVAAISQVGRHAQSDQLAINLS